MLRWDGMSCENCNSLNVMYDPNRTRGNPLLPKTHFTCRDCGAKFWAVADPSVVQPGLGSSRYGVRSMYWNPEARDEIHRFIMRRFWGFTGFLRKTWALEIELADTRYNIRWGVYLTIRGAQDGAEDFRFRWRAQRPELLERLRTRYRVPPEVIAKLAAVPDV